MKTHPLIIAKLSSLEKKAAPGSAVTVCFPALIRSGSTSSLVGNGPSPRIPFSDCKCTVMPAGMKFDAIMGMPMPRLAYTPSLNSMAARRTIFLRMSAAEESGLSEEDLFSEVKVKRWKRRRYHALCELPNKYRFSQI